MSDTIETKTIKTSDIAIGSIGQIAIAVLDIQEAVAFYRDVLGLSLLIEVPPAMAFFDCGGIRLMLTTLQGEERDHRTSVVYYKVNDLERAVESIKAQGIEFEREPLLTAKMEDHELWIGFLRDPSDNLVGLMAEVPL